MLLTPRDPLLSLLLFDHLIAPTTVQVKEKKKTRRRRKKQSIPNNLPHSSVVYVHPAVTNGKQTTEFAYFYSLNIHLISYISRYPGRKYFSFSYISTRGDRP